jgi:hypothetical protein
MENIVPPERRLSVMTAALGTLPFIATLWLLVVLGAAVLEESGGKIVAALKGEPADAPKLVVLSGGRRPRDERISPAGLRWRAAA